MDSIDWRLRISGGLIMFIIAGVAAKYALDLRSTGENYSQITVLALLAIWGGCDWIIKGISSKN